MLARRMQPNLHVLFEKLEQKASKRLGRKLQFRAGLFILILVASLLTELVLVIRPRKW